MQPLKSNTRYGGAKHSLFMYYGPRNLIPKCIIDVKYNEDEFITNYTL